MDSHRRERSLRRSTDAATAVASRDGARRPPVTCSPSLPLSERLLMPDRDPSASADRRTDAPDPVDVVGVGIGPFNLALAALADAADDVTAVFFDQQPEFRWHP